MKKINCSLVALCALLCTMLITPAYAAQEPLSLHVEYIYEDTVVENAEIKIYLVATLSNGKFVLSQGFETLDVEFQVLNSPGDWREEGETVAAYIEKEGCDSDYSASTDKNGLASFDLVRQGVYYVDVSDVTYKDGTLVSSPVLLTLPSYDETTGHYIYRVEMEPKVAYVENPPVTPPPVTPPPTTPPPTTPPPTDPPPTTPPPTTPPPTTPPFDPGTEDPLIGIPDPDVPMGLLDWIETIPQTGSWIWLALPLALMGLALTGLGLLGLRKKRGEP